MLFDAFICHASEDKDEFVRPLAEALRARHVEVWYDEFTLSAGHGLRRAIDKGLTTSRFGIVVLSPSFFDKDWPQWELDGLVTREIEEAANLILPIWHNISKQQVLRQSPSLANLVAIQSSKGITEVCNALLRRIHPNESPLLIARNELIKWDSSPPVITDEWWLDVVEASNRIPAFEAQIPERSTWGPWSFPLPYEGAVGAERGVRLAWTAMQMKWTWQAENLRICQITRPEDVHRFLRQMPGLYETCLSFPKTLANYAPQLMLRQYSGDFAPIFDGLLFDSEAECKKRGSRSGTALTIDSRPPLCDEVFSLRHESFGNYKAKHVADHFVRGSMWGPTYGFFGSFDYLVWLFSHDSNWLPQKTRQFLIEGLANGLTLSSHLSESSSILLDKLESARSENSFLWTKTLKSEWFSHVSTSLEKLGVTDSIEHIGSAIIEFGIIAKFFQERRR